MNKIGYRRHTLTHTQTHRDKLIQLQAVFFSDLVCNLSFRAHFNANLNLNFCYRKVNKTKLREQAKKHSVERGRGSGQRESKLIERRRKSWQFCWIRVEPEQNQFMTQNATKATGKWAANTKEMHPPPVYPLLAMGMLMWNGTEDSRKWKQRMRQRGRWNLVVSR